MSFISVMEHDYIVTEAKRPPLGEAIKLSLLMTKEGYDRQGRQIRCKGAFEMTNMNDKAREAWMWAPCTQL